MSENSIVPATPGGSLRLGTEPYPPTGAGTPPPPVNPLKMMHSFLRGHYILLSVLVVVLTPLTAWLGYKCGHKQFRTEGMLHINPVMQKILYTTEVSGQIPMFDEYMEVENARLSSKRVITMAAADPLWNAWHPPTLVKIDDRISEELQVGHPSGKGFLEVTVWDDDQMASALAVKTVINAYQQVYEEDRVQSQNHLMGVLHDRLDKESADIKTVKDRISAIVDGYGVGTDDLSKFQADAQEELAKLEAFLNYAPTDGPAGMPGAGGPPLTEDEMISRSNPGMVEALRAKADLETQLAIAKANGFGAQNVGVQNKQHALEVYIAQIQQFRKDFERANALASTGGNPATQPAGATTRPDVELRAKMAGRKVVVQNQLNQLGRDMLKLKDQKDALKRAEDALAETQGRYDSLQLESSGNNSRLDMISDGDASNSARDVKDTHVAMAALGGAMGVLISILIVALLSLSNRRFHGPEDTQFSQVRVPMLGMLPTLSSDLTDPEQSAMAAHFVHGIRAALQLKTNGESGRVLAITSPSPHNGKTSLSLALGVSFAGAHSKTLLIDCDFVGRALSSRVNAVAHPRLGRVLKHQGLVDEKELQEALDSPIHKGKRLGEALMDMGVVSTEKLKAALDAQKNQAFGVLEAIDGEDLAECVAPTDIPGLSILPLGQANAEHIGSLSPAMLRQVLETCKKKFDVVIVDTGPILGSLEAAMVATQADDVVVVLSSGENRAAAERSLRYLDSVGAKVAGFVFNRASTRDFVRSDSASRVSSSANRWAHAKNWTHSTQLSGFGPVAQAVARSVGEANAGKNNGNGNGNGGAPANGNGNGNANGNSNGNRRYGQSANGESHFS